MFNNYLISTFLVRKMNQNFNSIQNAYDIHTKLFIWIIFLRLNSVIFLKSYISKDIFYLYTSNNIKQFYGN